MNGFLEKEDFLKQLEFSWSIFGFFQSFSIQIVSFGAGSVHISDTVTLYVRSSILTSIMRIHVRIVAKDVWTTSNVGTVAMGSSIVLVNSLTHLLACLLSHLLSYNLTNMLTDTLTVHTITRTYHLMLAGLTTNMRLYRVVCKNVDPI